PDVPRSDRSVCPPLVQTGFGHAFTDKLDAYVRRYDFDGDVIWTHQFGSGVFDLVIGIGSDGTNVYASGDTSCNIQDDVSFSGGNIEGNRDVFATQIAIEPTTIPGKIQLLVGLLETLRDKGRLGPGEFTSLVSYLENAQMQLQSQD